MFETTSDKVLKVLIDNDKVISVADKLAAVKVALPSISREQIFSAIADLHRKNLIVVDFREGEIADIAVQPFALSRLTDSNDFKIFNLKWDVLKILFGYVLGFISAWLLR